MTPNVVEDARDSHDLVAQAHPRWAWLVVGLVLGAGAAVLVLGVGAPEASPISSEPDPVSSPTIGGVADVVEGFPDGLMGVTRSNGQSLELLIWPMRGELYERTIPVGVARPPGPVTFDQSGRRIGTVLPVPGEDLGVLYAGIPENAEIVATEVTGFAWHDSEPYQQAYTTLIDDELILWVIRLGVQSEMIARSVGIDGWVAAWGDWGYAVQDDVEGSVVLFTPTGEIRDTHPGRVLSSYSTGWLAIDNDGVELLSAGGGVRGLQSEGLEGEVLAGRFSGNGDRLALLQADELVVLSLDGEAETLEAGGDPGVPQLVWSSDGRFALYPGERGIWAVDTVNGDAVALLTDRVFTGLSVTPLGDQ